MSNALEYRKFCYWINSNNFEKLNKIFYNKQLRLHNETRIPCRILRRSIDLGVILPQAWESFCKRRTSWYMKSEKAGKCLIVGNHPLDLPELEETITISESHFKPDRCPSYEEMIPLTESEEYQKRKPLAWDQPDVKEIEFYRKGFGRYSMNEPFNFKKILQFHSANHANFIDPKYFVTQDGNPFPYSIADSVHTCSSCLEFFSILGKQWTTKYVIPCIGAVQFAKLPMDQYFEVTKLKRKEEGDGPHHTGTI